MTMITRTTLYALLGMLVALLMGACSAVPIGSYGKLARFDAMEADPADIRVAVRSSDAIDVRLARVEIEMSFTAPDGSLDEEHQFVVQPTDLEGFSARLTRDLEPGLVISTYRLEEDDAATMRDFQQRLARYQESDESGQWTLSIGLSGLCATRDLQDIDLPYAIYLKTEPSKDYFVMLRGDVGNMFEDEGVDVGEMPRCEEAT